MSAEICFFASNGTQIQDLSGSGLGFYGAAGFGASVPVGSYQGRTFICDAAGVNEGPECSNSQYVNSTTVVLGQVGTGIALTCVPNYQTPLNIRFTNNTPVQALNAQVQIFDRNNPNNNPSGVTCFFAEVIHPDVTQTNTGSGDTTWWMPGGSSVVVPLAPSPGVSGLYAGNGSNSTRPDTQHDWYSLISASPEAIGSKLFGLYISLEYL